MSEKTTDEKFATSESAPKPVIDVIPARGDENPTGKGVSYFARDHAIYFDTTPAVIFVVSSLADVALDAPLRCTHFRLNTQARRFYDVDEGRSMTYREARESLAAVREEERGTRSACEGVAGWGRYYSLVDRGAWGWRVSPWASISTNCATRRERVSGFLASAIR